jgi:uncharacterized protein (TIGR03905 family)
MTKKITYTTRGTCSKKINITVEDDIVTEVSFVGGCSGNTQGVASLDLGMHIDDVISRLKGIKCGFKPTSCPDQLACALESIKNAAE